MWPGEFQARAGAGRQAKHARVAVMAWEICRFIERLVTMERMAASILVNARYERLPTNGEIEACGNISDMTAFCPLKLYKSCGLLLEMR
jgi:hypothetical protein